MWAQSARGVEAEPSFCTQKRCVEVDNIPPDGKGGMLATDARKYAARRHGKSAEDIVREPAGLVLMCSNSGSGLAGKRVHGVDRRGGG